jgi:UDP-glucose:(heptosyl)LPS alpha-1,3-glucosyltransferase
VAWLWIGLQPNVKGLDRAITALASRPQVVLLICGVPRSHRELARMIAEAERRGFADRLRVLGIVSQQVLAELFTAADLLVHPARLEVTGTVILEAMANGLPVITTANCGFSVHVSGAKAGMVIGEPFAQAELEAALTKANAAQRAIWSANALAYCADPALYSGIARACELIEAAGRGDQAAWDRAGGMHPVDP